jgi:hypothetical protein
LVVKEFIDVVIEICCSVYYILRKQKDLLLKCAKAFVPLPPKGDKQPPSFLGSDKLFVNATFLLQK